MSGINAVTSAPSTSALGDKERLGYLVDLYKLYHGHINTMFNYFLILSGLLATACIQSMQKQADISREVSAVIALFGAFLSVIALLIHLRSREMLDTIEQNLAIEEEVMFTNAPGFLKYGALPRRSFLRRHKYQFQMTYSTFIIGFAALGCFAGWGRIQEAVVLFNSY